ncbi:MAG: NUDIX hydrolase [Patescibacteria group bacterium]
MEIPSMRIWKGKEVNLLYKDIDHVDELEGRICMGVRVYCFHGDKLVITYSERKDMWEPAGGNVEEEELVTDAMIRELEEETNMKAVRHACIGYEDIFAPEGTKTLMRFVCIGEPYGEFVEDPDEGEISKIELIDPADYRKYFDWGIVGEHMIKRALEIKKGWRV